MFERDLAAGGAAEKSRIGERQSEVVFLHPSFLASSND